MNLATSVNGDKTGFKTLDLSLYPPCLQNSGSDDKTIIQVCFGSFSIQLELHGIAFNKFTGC